jgi:sugar lactone lactonase YvrE
MLYPRLRVHATLLTCAAVLVACDSSKQVAPTTATASLKVTITSANGNTPAVVVSGPNSYRKTVASTSTITGLALGGYTIVADSTVVPDSVVGVIIDTASVSGGTVTLTAGDTATATVVYAMKSRMGGLWVANNNSDTLPELSANQLRGGGSPTPAELFASAASSPAGLALDASGDLWESSEGGGTTLDMYTPAARNGGGAPSRTLTSNAIGDAQDLAFDGHGNLWVADADGQLLEYTPTQLAAGGSQAPTVTINGGSVLSCPYSMAFDSSGNAWVADDCNNHVVEYSAAQLGASGTPTPTDTIGANGESLSSPDGVAFDAKGNLWVSNDGTNIVVAFTPAQLTAGGAPVPNVTIALPVDADPYGVAFDDRGTLWVSDYANGIMYGLSGAQLAASGSPTASVIDTLALSGSGFGPEQPLFDPYATAVAASASRVGPHVVAAGSIHIRGRRHHPRESTH